MGAAVAFIGLLADAVTTAQDYVHVFVLVYVLVIFVYILMSWVRLPYSTWANRIQRFLYDVCDPYLRLFRRVLPPLGPLDLSPIVAVIVLGLIDLILNRLLETLH
jgi:YggT family protein